MTLEKFVTIVTPIILGLLAAAIKQIYNYAKTNSFDLTKHSIFDNIKFTIERLNTWKDCQENRVVFVDTLEMFLKIWSDKLMKVAKNVNKDKYSRTILRDKFTNLIIDVLKETNTTRKLNNVPTKVMLHVERKELTLLDKFKTEISIICMDNTIPRAYVRRAVLDNLKALLNELIGDWHDIIYRDAYNGYFKGVSYRGIPINDKEYELYYAKELGKDSYNNKK